MSGVNFLQDFLQSFLEVLDAVTANFVQLLDIFSNFNGFIGSNDLATLITFPV